MNGKYWQRGLTLVDGCTPCSPGCDHCWSASMAHRFHGFKAEWHPERLTDDNAKFTGKIITHPDRLSVPLKRRKSTVYAVWNDLFHDAVPFEFLCEAYLEMCNLSHHTFLILTKRPKGMVNFVRAFKMSDFPHIYHGLTVCNQQEADEKIPIFLQIPGKKFLSIEPMLGEIDLHHSFYKSLVLPESEGFVGLDVVILGGETGPRARPMHPDWVRFVRDQCKAVGVPFFLKHINKKEGRLLDGREHNDLPWRQL